MTETPVLKLNKPTVSGDADAWGGQLNENADDLEVFLTRPRFKKVAPTVGATTTLDFGVGNFFEFTVGQATTIAFANVPATLPDTTVPVVRGFLRITNGGAFTITWPGSIVWPFETANLAPTGLASAGVDIIELVSYDAGTTWYATLLHIKTSPNLDPRVSAYKSSNQSAPPGTTTVTFDSERFDVGTMHDNVTNNARFTVPTGQGGLYHLHAQVNLSAGADIRTILRKNGSTVLRRTENYPFERDTISGYEVLVAGDYIEVLVENSSVSSDTIKSGLAETSFDMVRVR